MKNEKPKKILLLEKLLSTMAVLVLKKYRPRVVAITGSVGKTSAKEAVFIVLANKFRVRRSEKNYNNEIGVPLTIIGAESGKGSIWGWLKVFLKWTWMMVWPVKYPEILILEMGADRPGDIQYLTSFVKAEVGIITDVSYSHIEFFKSPEEIAREKGALVRGLDENGLAILNVDNAYVGKLKEQTKSKVIGIGFSESADMRATDMHFNYEDGNEKEIKGLSFKLNYGGTVIPVRLNDILARHQIYPALAAAAVGTRFGLNLVEISEALTGFIALCGRMNLLDGLKNTRVIDDTYNASPASVLAALDALGEIKAGRKIAVLGDMLELGSETERSHRELAKRFLKIQGDIFFAVGKRMRFAADELKKRHFPPENIFSFDDPEKAGRKLQEIIWEGDLILVKGSQGMRMEKTVEEIMAEPQKAGDLLCRQNQDWKNRPFVLQ